MTSKQYKSLGLAVSLAVPATVEEFDLNANKGDATKAGGACLSEAINNCVYRGSLAIFRDVFLHGQVEVKDETTGEVKQPAIRGVEEITGIERLTEAVMKDGKPVTREGEPVLTFIESEGKYFSRVLASLVKDGKFTDEEAALASFQSLADEVAKSIDFDASASERKSAGPRKLAAKYKIAAAKSLARGTTEKVNGIFANTIKKSFTPSNDTEKLFTGKYPHVDTDGKAIEVDFSVSDKDAEALGWLLKENSDWKAAQELASINE